MKSLYLSYFLVVLSLGKHVIAAAKNSSNLAAASSFERSQFANDSVAQGAFYKALSSSGAATPGTLLKVEADANASAYNLPPVVAPDYVGLGVEKTADGRDIVHQYLASPAHASDVFHAAQAAQAAFLQLTSEFVVMGHSQGGGAARAAAQRQAIRPVKGYLGSIAISPLANLSELPQSDNPLIDCVGAFMTPGMQALAGMPVAIALLIDIQLLKQGWRNDSYVKEYVNLTANGGAKIERPLYVIQGEDDPNMHLSTTTSAVDKTNRNYPDSQLDYVCLSTELA
ncbi:MAG: hypothetical protein L6R37_000678 [Teloschistes peruensis]|nr:MAG: hypothetical protein L6R37_000678 [Teloschistes peruensis]